MAQKKPRLRKTAPTIRERVESAQQTPSGTSGKVSGISDKLKKPLKKVKLPQNRATSAIGRVLKKIVPNYFINSWREVRQVTWPSRRETWRLTGAVFIFAIIFGVMVAAVDKGLDTIFRNLVLN